jgi:hypothetical protein
MYQMDIQPSAPSDLSTIFELFEAALLYQEERGYDLWPRFSEELIMKEIDDKRHFKILQGPQIVAILSVQYSDPAIWGPEKQDEPALYLHRIAVHPSHKGKRMMVLIRDWSIRHARTMGKRFVRMDTWGNNRNLRDYYVSCGWPCIGQRTLTPASGELPHYGGDYLSLFQLSV